MKLGHYLHIAPRTVFLAQGLATLIGAVVQCGVTVFMITRIKGVCTSEAEGGFSCPHGRVTYSSSLIWGECLPSKSINPESKILSARRPRPRPKLLPRPNLRRPPLVLPHRPRCRPHHIRARPPLENSQLPLLARRLWSHESCPARDRNQLFLLVGG